MILKKINFVNHVIAKFVIRQNSSSKNVIIVPHHATLYNHNATLCLDVEVIKMTSAWCIIISISDEEESLVSNTQAQINLILLCSVGAKSPSENNI